MPRTPNARGGRKRAPRQQPPDDPQPRDDERDEPDDEPQPERASTLDEFIAGIVAEGGADQHQVLVYRRPTSGPNVGKLEYLAPRIPLTEFSFDVVRQRNGGGNYEFRITRPNERGVQQIARTFSQTIAGAPRVDVEPATSLPPGGPVAVVAAPAVPQPDRIERLERLVTKLAKRLEQPPAANPLDMLEKVGAIVQSFRKGDGGAGGDVMQWLRLGLQLGAKQNGGQPDGFDKFLGELAGPFAQLLTAPNGGAPVTAPTMPGVRTTPLAPPAPTMAGDPAAAKLTPVWLQLVAPYLGFVYGWAKAGDDPRQRAQVALAMIPAPQLETLATAAEAADFVQTSLDALPPAFQQPPVREWMQQFLTAIESELTEPVPETEGATNGNA